MSSYKPTKSRTKIDWFVDGILKQTFESYIHASEVFKKEFEIDICETTIRNLLKNKLNVNVNVFRKIHIFKNDTLIKSFNTNIELMKYFNLISTSHICNVIKNGFLKDYKIKITNNIPDIRLHEYEETDVFCICSYCKESKPFTEQNFNYKNKEKKIKNTRCNKCSQKIIGNKFIDEFIENNIKSGNWKHHPDYTNFYFEKDTTKIYNIETGKYMISNPVINKKEMISRNLKWEAFYGKIQENMVVKYKNKIGLNDNDGIELDNLECGYIYCDNCEKIIENPTINLKYCSEKCQKIISKNNKKNNINNNLKLYVSQKFSVQKNTNKKSQDLY